VSSRRVKAGQAYIVISIEDEQAVAELLKFQKRLKTISERMDKLGGLGAKLPSVVAPFRMLNNVTMTIGPNLRRASVAFATFGRSVTRVGRSIINFRNIAIGGFGFGMALKEAADIESLEGRFNQVFGHLRGEMSKFADDLGKEINRSPRVIRDAMSQYQAVLRGIGHSNREAAMMVKEAVKSQLDVEAVKDDLLTRGQAVRTLIGGFTGSNTEGIASIFGAPTRGIDLQRKLDIVAKDLDLADASAARLHLILKAMGEANVIGQAAREANQLATVLKRSGEAVRDLSGTVMLAVSGPIQKLLQQFIDISVKLEDWVRENKSVVMQMAAIGVSVVGIGVALTVAGTAISMFSVVVSSLVVGMAALKSLMVFLITPFGLITAMAAAAAVAFFDWGSIADSVFAKLTRGINNSIHYFKFLGVAIKNAIDAEDIGLAIDIAVKGAAVFVRRGIVSMLEPLDGVRLKIGGFVQSIMGGITDAVLFGLSAIDSALMKIEQSIQLTMIKIKHWFDPELWKNLAKQIISPLNPTDGRSSFGALFKDAWGIFRNEGLRWDKDVLGIHKDVPFSRTDNLVRHDIARGTDRGSAEQFDWLGSGRLKDKLDEARKQFEMESKQAEAARESIRQGFMRMFTDQPAHAPGSLLWGPLKWFEKFKEASMFDELTLSRLIEIARTAKAPEPDPFNPHDPWAWDPRDHAAKDKKKKDLMRSATQGVAMSGIAPRAFHTLAGNLEPIVEIKDSVGKISRLQALGNEIMESVDSNIDALRGDVRDLDGPQPLTR